MTTGDVSEEKSDYLYEILVTTEDIEMCARIAAESFTESNPFTRFHGFTFDHFYEHVSVPLMNELINERLSMLARNRYTRQIVGCVIAGDLYLERLRYKPDSGSFAIGDLLNELDEMFIRSNTSREGQLKPNLILHISLVATKLSEIGKGIMSQLIYQVCRNAQKTGGFKYAYAQITHPASRHIFEKKLGAKIVSHIDPTTWLWKRRGDTCPYPYKEWTGGPIVNIRLALADD